MGDTGFPGQQTTTTVTSNTTVQTNIRFDASYIKTIPGILKICQVVLNFLGFICIEVSGVYLSRGSFYNSIVLIGFWFTGILLAFYLFHIIEKFYKIPWLKIEFVICIILAVLLMVAAALCAAVRSIEAYSVAAFFGFCVMVLYGCDAFLKFRKIQAGELAQGERVITKQTSTVNSPTY